MYPRIYKRHEMSNEEYHSSPGVSRSSLWTIHSRTPAHYKYGERKAKDGDALAIGTAIHTAILEPEEFLHRIFRGPADRRGNKWAEACSAARLSGCDEILRDGDFEMVLRIRDSAAKNSTLNALRRGLVIESSAFYEETDGTILRCRPDGYHPSSELMVDIKSTADASEAGFASSVARYGYHVQDPYYSDVWQAAGGGNVSGFIFLAFEKEPPYLVADYELDMTAQDEGRRIYKSALEKYRQCMASGEWPGYASGPKTLSLPRWAAPKE